MFNYALEGAPFITIIEASDWQDAWRTLESLHPRVKLEAMVGISGPHQKPVEREMISSGSNICVEYINRAT
jgi:hypothetical protein